MSISLMCVESSFLAILISARMARFEDTSNETMKTVLVSMAMLFIRVILSVLTTQLETLVRQPSE